MSDFPVQYIESINVLSFSFIEKAPTLIKKESLYFNLTTEHKSDVEASALLVKCTIEILSDEANEILAQITIVIHYHAPFLGELVNEKTKEVELPFMLGAAINGITISTTRGIFYSKLQGSQYEGVILPIVDPKIMSGNETEKKTPKKPKKKQAQKK